MNKSISCYISIIAVVASYIFASTPNNSFIVIGIIAIAYLFIYARTSHMLFFTDSAFVFLIVFCGYSLLSSLWANSPTYAFQAGLSYFLCILIFMLFAQVYIARNINAFDVILVSGICVGLYTIFEYGPAQIIYSLIGINRLKNTFCNVNLLGILFSYTIIIAFKKFMDKKNIAYVLIIVFQMLMLLATQSRKALVIVAIGILGIILINKQQRISISQIIKTMLMLLLVILLMYAMSKLSAFAAINERIDGLIAAITGKGNIDGSMALRLLYIDIGMDAFKAHPLLGIGMDNARTIISQAQYHHNTYTHCNYVELLCDGGIFGFVIYYSFHFYLFVQFIKGRKYWSNYSKMCIGFLIILIVMDYGMVSYIEKTNWISLLPVFLEARRLKKKVLE